MNQILTTDRLLLSEFNICDADFIIELLNSPGWLQFIGNRNINTKKDAINYINNTFINNYKKNGYGFWKVELKGTGQPIGMCGITKRVGLDNVDFGFAFLPSFFGKGYGIEIALATLNFVLTTFELPNMLAITNPDNIRSIRLLEKIGFQYQHKIKMAENGEELNLYRIEKELI